MKFRKQRTAAQVTEVEKETGIRYTIIYKYASLQKQFKEMIAIGRDEYAWKVCCFTFYH